MLGIIQILFILDYILQHPYPWTSLLPEWTSPSICQTHLLKVKPDHIMDLLKILQLLSSVCKKNSLTTHWGPFAKTHAWGAPHFGLVFLHCLSPLIARASRGPWFLFCPFEVLLDTPLHTWSRPDAQRSSGLLAGLGSMLVPGGGPGSWSFPTKQWWYLSWNIRRLSINRGPYSIPCLSFSLLDTQP